MTLAEIAPPIAAATTINAFLFALMWRGGQIEKWWGDPPWWLVLGFLAYIAALSGFAYIRGVAQLGGWLDVFGAAMVGEAAGGVLVHSILSAAVFTRDRPRGERLAHAAFAVVATGLAFAGLFAG